MSFVSLPLPRLVKVFYVRRELLFLPLALISEELLELHLAYFQFSHADPHLKHNHLQTLVRGRLFRTAEAQNRAF